MAARISDFNKIPPQIKSVADALFNASWGFRGVSAHYPAVTVTQDARTNYDDFPEVIGENHIFRAQITTETLIIIEMLMDVTESQQLRKIAELKIINPDIKFDGLTDLDYIFLPAEMAAGEHLQPWETVTEAKPQKERLGRVTERVYLTLTVTMNMSGREWQYNPEKRELFVLHRKE